MSKQTMAELEILKQYIAIQNEYVEKARRMKHDMTAHFIVLKYYLADEKYTEASAYLNKLMKENEGIQIRNVDLGNGLVNAIVIGVLEKQKKEIAFQYMGLIPKELQVEDKDLCTIFSNVMRNAVEACERLQEKPGKITLILQQDETDLNVVVENPVEWVVPEELLGKGTTKSDKEYHGYGIKNVYEAVNRYNGSLNFYVTEGKFRAEIRLRNVVKTL